MNSTFRINELKAFLKKYQPVKTKQIVDFYRTSDSTISCNTIRWRIHELKAKQIIYSPARGQYALQEKASFFHDPTKSINSLTKLVQKKHPTAKFSLYSTEWLTRFSNFTYPSNNLIIDIETDSLNIVYNSIKKSCSNTFLSPNETKYDYYISPDRENIIVNRLYVDAPLKNVDSSYYIPKLEKILVDLMINDPIILMISKPEMKYIISNIQKTYHINYSTLRRYAQKRHFGKKETAYGLLKV